MKKGYNANTNSYNDIAITWDNIEVFGTLFLEAQYRAFDLQLEQLEHEDNLKGNGYKNKHQIYTTEKHLKAVEDNVKKDLTDVYKIIWTIRKRIEIAYNTNDSFKIAVDERAKEDFVWWINSFAWTYDPRLTRLGVPATTPLILFPRQREVLEEIDRCYKEGVPYLVEKSRAMGLTEIICAYDIHHFLYIKGYQKGWGSRIKDLVDKSGSPDTIFERLRRILYSTPVKMRPKTFQRRGGQNDNTLRLSYPESQSYIIGEGGLNIGRGGRSTHYTIDEAASLEAPEAIENSLSENTSCHGSISTPKGANYFYQKRNSGKVRVITFGWWENPSMNDKWQERKKNPNSAFYVFKKKTRDEVAIAQELDINYHASIAGIMIPSEWVMAAIDFDLPDTGDRVAGYDLAAGGRDLATYVFGKGVVVKKIEKITAKTPMEGTWKAVELCDRDGVELLAYDRNVIGEDVYPQLKQGDRRVNFRLNGIYGQSPASSTLIETEGKRACDLYRNKRGEIWMELRKRFEKTYLHKTGTKRFPSNEMISIPNHIELIAELSTPLLVYSATGKIGVESKREMRVRHVASPNYADALAYWIERLIHNPEVMDNFAYQDDKAVQELIYNGLIPHDVHVSLYLSDEQILYLIIARHSFVGDKIEILFEKRYEYPDPVAVRSDVDRYIGNFKHLIKTYTANSKFFEGLETGQRTLWYDFRRENLRLKQNYSFNYSTALLIMNKLFANNRLIINNSCSDTINQIRNWSLVNGKPKENLNYCNAVLEMLQNLIKNNNIAIKEDVVSINKYHKIQNVLIKSNF
jgi:hypothetical protein